MKYVPFFVIIFAIQSRGDTLHVPAIHPTIQSAIQVAQPGDTVLVAPGTYVELVDFLGKDIAVVSSGGPLVTTIDGGLLGTVVRFASGEGAQARLEGFTITNGLGAPSPIDPISDPGGILCVGASPTIRSCVITGNHGGDGPPIFNLITPPRGGGGAMTLRGGSRPILEECAIRNNQGGDGSTIPPFLPQRGGAGGIGSIASALEMRRCIVEGNVGGVGSDGTSGGQGGSGGLNIEAFEPIVLDSCLIRGNVAGDGGIGSTFSQVSAGAGGISLAGPVPALIVNCLIADNVAGTSPNQNGVGGATLVLLDCHVVNCTITGNQASGPQASGGLVVNTGAGPYTVTNTIVWGNTPDDLVPNLAATITVRYSDVGGGAFGTANIDVDPEFVDAPGGDYHLSLFSPCLDAGDSGEPLLPALDGEGQLRVVGSSVDIGADELELDACLAGNVGGATPFPVLSVNGSSAPGLRLATGQSIALSLAAPPGTASASMILFAFLDELDGASEELVLPFGVGSMCFDPTSSLSLLVASSFPGVPALLPHTAAPFAETSAAGSPVPLGVTFQGLMIEPPGIVRVTNAVSLRVE